MDQLRVERTLLHKGFGIFRYSQELAEHGIVSPAQQIVAIGHFIEEGLGKLTVLPQLHDEEALCSWMKEKLTEVLPVLLHVHEVLEPLSSVAIRTMPLVAWNTYREFAELLNFRCGAAAYARSAARLRARGFDVHLADLSGLAQQFLLVRLPRAVQSFSPVRGEGHEEAWLASVFYRFALGELLSDRTNKHQLEEFDNDLAIQETPQIILERESEHETLSELPRAMEQLSPRDRLAIELYFGFRGEEHALSEIAAALGASEYLARASIVNGLSKLAVLLNVHGGLDEREFALLKLTTGEGVALGSAATQLGMSLKDARELNSRILRTFRRGLRIRTSSSTRASRPLSERKVGEGDLTTEITIDAISDNDILKTLRDLQQVPSLKVGPGGEIRARLGENFVPLARVREVAGRPEILESLQKLQVPLDWLAIPDPTAERADLLDDVFEWTDALQEVSRRSSVVAELLYERCKDEAVRGAVAFFPEERIHAIERISRMLAGVSQTIESELPRELRHAGVARFRIEKDKDGRARGFWEENARKEHLDVGAVVEEQAQLLGEIPEDLSKILAKLLIEELFGGQASLPGFQLVRESTASAVWLEWHPPSVHIPRRREVAIAF